MVPIFQERGLSAIDAAAALTAFAGCLAVMQLLGGILADRVRAPFLLFTGMAGLALAMLLLFFADTSHKALVAGAALGVSQGIYFGATHPLWARYFGRRHLGKIRGMLMTINIGSSSLGPLFAGLTRDWQGDFDMALVVFAIAPLPIAVFSLLVAPPPRGTLADVSRGRFLVHYKSLPSQRSRWSRFILRTRVCGSRRPTTSFWRRRTPGLAAT